MKKTQLNPFLLFISILIFSVSVFAQGTQDLSQITPGKSYKIVLFDDTEILGMVSAVDSVNITVKKDNGTSIIIPRNNILYFSTDLNPSKYRYAFSVNGGVSLLSNNEFGYASYYSKNTLKGPTADVSAEFFLSPNKAIMLDAGFSSVKANYDGYYSQYASSDPTHQSSISGGDMMFYSFKCNLVFGSFKPEERLIYSGHVGVGIHLLSQKEINEIQYYRSYPDTGTWRSYQYYYPEHNEVNLVIDIGGSLGYRVSKHFGIKAEAEFDMVTSKDYFIIFGGRNYFPLRLGVFYVL